MRYIIIIGALIALGTSGCSRWKIEKSKSPMTDETFVRLSVDSNEEFVLPANAFRKSDFKYHPRLSMVLRPTEMVFGLWLGVSPKTRGFHPNEVMTLSYRTDEKPAVTLAAHYDDETYSAVWPLDAATAVLAANTVRVQYTDASAGDRIVTFQVAGFADAIRKACGDHDTTFDCNKSSFLHEAMAK